MYSCSYILLLRTLCTLQYTAGWGVHTSGYHYLRKYIGNMICGSSQVRRLPTTASGSHVHLRTIFTIGSCETTHLGNSCCKLLSFSPLKQGECGKKGFLDTVSVFHLFSVSQPRGKQQTSQGQLSHFLTYFLNIILAPCSRLPLFFAPGLFWSPSWWHLSKGTFYNTKAIEDLTAG